MRVEVGAVYEPAGGDRPAPGLAVAWERKLTAVEVAELLDKLYAVEPAVARELLCEVLGRPPSRWATGPHEWDCSDDDWPRAVAMVVAEYGVA